MIEMLITNRVEHLFFLLYKLGTTFDSNKFAATEARGLKEEENQKCVVPHSLGNTRRKLPSSPAYFVRNRI